jgi:L-threonylcarbamoyladenylate synthase
VQISDIDDIPKLDSTKNAGVGLLAFAPLGGRDLPPNIVKIEHLSKTGDLREAACNLFAAMRKLDAATGVDIIAALPVPNTGLGLAINDRLKKASAKG